MLPAAVPTGKMRPTGFLLCVVVDDAVSACGDRSGSGATVRPSTRAAPRLLSLSLSSNDDTKDDIGMSRLLSSFARPLGGRVPRPSPATGKADQPKLTQTIEVPLHRTLGDATARCRNDVCQS